MQRSTLRAAALAAALSFSPLAFAQQSGDASSNRNSGNSDRPQQQLEQTKQQEKAEARQQGDRKVEVREMALWSLGDLPPKLMHKAMEKLADEPAEARKAVMQAANIFELQASLAMQKQGMAQQAQGQQQQEQQKNPAQTDRGLGAYQASGAGDWSNTRDQNLWRAAEDLRELAMKIEYKQVLTKDELREPFSKAALSMAAFYHKAAEAGLKRQDEEQTGYTLKGAADYFAAAHAFGQRKPTPEVSRAIFDSDRLANQIVKLSKPTTLQKDLKNDAAKSGGQGDLADAARTAGSQQGGNAQQRQQLPQEAEQVVRNLGQAIQQTQPAGGQDRQGVNGNRGY
jgi:hypothetical protein